MNQHLKGQRTLEPYSTNGSHHSLLPEGGISAELDGQAVSLKWPAPGAARHPVLKAKVETRQGRHWCQPLASSRAYKQMKWNIPTITSTTTTDKTSLHGQVCLSSVRIREGNGRFVQEMYVRLPQKLLVNLVVHAGNQLFGRIRSSRPDSANSNFEASLSYVRPGLKKKKKGKKKRIAKLMSRQLANSYFYPQHISISDRLRPCQLLGTSVFQGIRHSGLARWPSG